MASKRSVAAGKAAPRRPEVALRVLVLSGPNLDRLGQREPHIYGRETLAEIYAALKATGARRGVEVDCRQTNHEGVLIDWMNAAKDDGFDGILINAGALTHTSYALHDSLKGSELPAVEVHISNPDAREGFRRVSCIAAACKARVSGFGAASYAVALSGLVDLLCAARTAPEPNPRPPGSGRAAAARPKA